MLIRFAGLKSIPKSTARLSFVRVDKYDNMNKYVLGFNENQKVLDQAFNIRKKYGNVRFHQ